MCVVAVCVWRGECASEKKKKKKRVVMFAVFVKKGFICLFFVLCSCLSMDNASCSHFPLFSFYACQSVIQSALLFLFLMFSYSHSGQWIDLLTRAGSPSSLSDFVPGSPSYSH